MEKVLSDDTFLFWDLRPGGLKPAISPDSAAFELAKPDESPAAPQTQGAPSAKAAAKAAEAQALQAHAQPAGASPAPAASAMKPASMTAASPASAAMHEISEEEGLAGVTPNEKAQAPSPMPQSKVAAQASQAHIEQVPLPQRAEPQGLDANQGGIVHAEPQMPEAAAMRPQAAVPPAFGDPSGDPSAPSYPGWHLRKKRADVFVDLQSGAPFLKPLCDYLKSKGLSVLGYDQGLHYLPYDVILADKARLHGEGRSAALDGGKAAVWTFLKREFAGRL